MKEGSVVGVIILLLVLGGFYLFFTQRAQAPAPLETNDNTMSELTLTSTAFEHEGSIPSQYSCDGEDINPPLVIDGVPKETKSLVLLMDDPDAPAGTWDHWIVVNIAPKTTSIPENTEPEGVGGNNSWGRTGYGGPCPPEGEHRYFFKLFALDAKLDLSEGATKAEVEKAIEGHVLSQTELMGRYKRK